MKGRFGPYCQRGEVTEDNKKPPRQSVPKDWAPEDLTLEEAVRLLALPRLIGQHPEDGVNVWANIGRYGPYIKHAESTSDRGGTNANLEGLDEVWTVGMNRAVQLLAEKVASRKGRGQAKVLKELGDHPEAGAPVQLLEGRVRPLREVGEDQCHPARRGRAGHGDPGQGGGADSRTCRQDRQEGRAEEGGREENHRQEGAGEVCGQEAGGEIDSRQEAGSQEGPGEKGRAQGLRRGMIPAASRPPVAREAHSRPVPEL